MEMRPHFSIPLSALFPSAFNYSKETESVIVGEP